MGMSSQMITIMGAKMSKHTKGPWVAMTQDAKGAVLSHPDGNLVAECDAKDASLISAAPEMAEALESAIGVLIQISDQETGTQGPIYKALHACIAATAKAKGGSNE